MPDNAPVSQTAEITFTHPVQVDGMTYDRATVRDLSVAELRSIGHRNSNEFVRGMKITALATGLPLKVLHEVEPVDMKKIAAFLFRSEV